MQRCCNRGIEVYVFPTHMDQDTRGRAPHEPRGARRRPTRHACRRLCNTCMACDTAAIDRVVSNEMMPRAGCSSMLSRAYAWFLYWIVRSPIGRTFYILCATLATNVALLYHKELFDQWLDTDTSLSFTTLGALTSDSTMLLAHAVTLSILCTALMLSRARNARMLALGMRIQAFDEAMGTQAYHTLSGAMAAHALGFVFWARADRRIASVLSSLPKRVHAPQDRDITLQFNADVRELVILFHSSTTSLLYTLCNFVVVFTSVVKSMHGARNYGTGVIVLSLFFSMLYWTLVRVIRILDTPFYPDGSMLTAALHPTRSNAHPPMDMLDTAVSTTKARPPTRRSVHARVHPEDRAL